MFSLSMIIFSLCGLCFASVSPMVPLVYVYVATPFDCSNGIARYIIDTLLFASSRIHKYEPNDLILISNFDECNTTMPTLKKEGLLSRLQHIDINQVESKRTKNFIEQSKRTIIPVGPAIATITRFFYLEDMMTAMSLSSILHSELDNLMFGSIAEQTSILRILYPNQLAAVPLLSSNISTIMITSAAMWIPQRGLLNHLTTFFESVVSSFESDSNRANQKSMWKDYLKWMHLTNDSESTNTRSNHSPPLHLRGIRPPGTVNELTLLAFYRHTYPKLLTLFPTDYASIPSFVHITMNDTLPMAWDAGYWGQLVGGTHRRMRKPAITQTDTPTCKVRRQCIVKDGSCFAAPLLHCPNQPIQRLWNLHILSKNIHGSVMQMKCICSKEVKHEI